jgi:hypothetical protein
MAGSVFTTGNVKEKTLDPTVAVTGGTGATGSGLGHALSTEEQGLVGTDPPEL